ncbi:MAG: hypothetical protein CL609_25105 [Anaerolineaceae bacterium]|nr:hypothetical protein [Anaerolineaceae bacterium]
MIDIIEDYIETFGEQTKQRFGILYHLILESTDEPIEEKLWARIPSFYCGKSFIRFIPFKDHINIEAKAIMVHKEKCHGYKITPKGMLKLDHKQEIPVELLKMIFKESLETK